MCPAETWPMSGHYCDPPDQSEARMRPGGEGVVKRPGVNYANYCTNKENLFLAQVFVINPPPTCRGLVISPWL